MEYKFLNKLGKFWIGTDKENSFQGIIIKKNNIFILNVLNKEFEGLKNNYSLINGYIESTKICFKISNYHIAKSVYKNGKNFEYQIMYLFTGKFFNTFEEIKFKKISIGINNINSVIDLSSVVLENLEPENGKIYPLYIKENEEKEINFNLKNFKIEIKNILYQKWNLLGNGESIKIVEESRIILEYYEPQKIINIIRDISKIKDLFSFLTKNSEIIDIKEISQDKHVDMLLPIISKEYKLKRDFYSSIKLNEKNIENVFKKWFENYSKYNSVYDLFFSIDDTKFNDVTLLLTYCQIIESYHRQKYHGLYLTKEKFEEFRKQYVKCANKSEEMKSIVDEKDREHFRNKVVNSINFSYEYTLKDRLIELFTDLYKFSIMKKILNNYSETENEEKQIKEFCEIIKDNRNYYTHYGEKRKNVFVGKELIELNNFLKLIINLILLNELEFEVKEINKITENSDKFSFIEFI